MKNTNKIRYTQAVLGAIVAALALSCMILSCAQPEGSISAGGQVGKGSVTITAFPGSSGSGLKTILPTETPEFTRYVVVLKSDSNSYEIDSDEETDLITGLEGDGYERELEAGTWTVTVTAYRDFTIEGQTVENYPAAEGESTELVYAGNPINISVPLKPLPIDWTGDDGAVQGTFSYELIIPSAATGTLALEGITPVELSGTGSPVEGDNTKKSFSGSLAVAPGYYQLSINLDDGDLGAALLEEVHIYPGLDTTGEFAFDEDDFTSRLYFAGTIILPEGKTFGSGTIGAYSDAAYSSPVGTAFTLSGTDWLLDIPKGNLAGIDKLYFKAQVTGGDSKIYVSTGSTAATKLTDAGELGIKLEDKTDPGAVTSLSAVPGTGDGKVTLSWTNPNDPDFDHIEITWTPDGTEPTVLPKTTTTYTAEGLTKGIEYNFTVTTVDTAGRKASTPKTATPLIEGNMSMQELEELLDQLSDDADISIGGGAVTQAVTLNLGSRNVTITGDFEVPENVTLQVEKGGKLTVDKDITLAIEGALKVADEAELTVNGTVSAGTKATITVPALKEGSLPVPGADIKGTGEVDIAQGATVYYSAIPFLGKDDDDPVKFVYNWSEDSSNGELVLGKGMTTLSAGTLSAVVNNTIVPADTSIVIAPAAVLNVIDDVQLIVKGTIDLTGDSSEPALLIVPDFEENEPVNGGIVFDGAGKIKIGQGANYQYGSKSLIDGTSGLYDWASGSSGGQLTLTDRELEVSAGTLAVVDGTEVSEEKLIKKITVAKDAEFNVTDKTLAVGEGGEIEVNGTLAVAKSSSSASLTVSEGGSVRVTGEGSTLSIGEAALTVDEGGSLVVEGKLEVTETGGSFTVKDGATFAATGEVEVKGPFDVKDGAVFTATGEVVAGGSFTVNDLTIAGDLTLEGVSSIIGVLTTEGKFFISGANAAVTVNSLTANGSLEIDNAAGKLTLSGESTLAGPVTVKGEIVLDGDDAELTISNTFKLSDTGAKLTITKGTAKVAESGSVGGPGTISVAENAELTVDGTLEIPSTSKLEVTGTATLNKPVNLAGEIDVKDKGTLTVENTTLALPSINGTITVAGGGSIEVSGASGKIDARRLLLGAGTWKATTASATITRDTITLEKKASGKFGKDNGDSATVLTGGDADTNTFAGNTKDAVVSLTQDGNKLIITGAFTGDGTKYPTLKLGATAGISEKGGLTITNVTVDISEGATIKLLNGGAGITLSNSDSEIVLDSGKKVLTEEKKAITGLTAGTDVQVYAGSDGGDQDVGKFVGASGSNNTLTGGDAGFEIKKGIKTASS